MSPWTSTSKPDGWIDHLASCLGAWRPALLDAPAAAAFKAAVADCARAREAWLYHPFVAAITARAEPPLAGELNLFAWAAFQERMPDLELAVAPGAQLLDLGGDYRALAGRRSCAQLAATLSSMRRRDVALVVPPGTAPPSAGARMTFERHREQIRTRMPQLWAWIAAATTFAAALPPAATGSFSSRSSPDEPGVVYLTLGGDILQTLEALVHETAHLHLFREERVASLTNSAEARFRSPLRADPRPLRGVLLAMHACAHIAAAFREAEACGLDHPLRCRAQRMEMLDLFREAREVVESARRHLTDAGAAFVERTAAVAEHAATPALSAA